MHKTQIVPEKGKATLNPYITNDTHLSLQQNLQLLSENSFHIISKPQDGTTEQLVYFREAPSRFSK